MNMVIHFQICTSEKLLIYALHYIWYEQIGQNQHIYKQIIIYTQKIRAIESTFELINVYIDTEIAYEGIR